VIPAALLALLCLVPLADAELSQEGDLIASFGGGISPTALPRAAAAPVSVRVAGDVRSATGDEDGLPQLQAIKVGINRQGKLFDRGLPVCAVRSIQPATVRAARKACGSSIIGTGHVTVRAHLPSQSVFEVDARLLAFNGPRRNGHKLILAQAYARSPPGSFVLAFVVKQGKGLFGTTMTTSLPRSAQRWAYLTHFDMTLHRVYEYHGARRSFISAACSAPAGFESAVFPFARASYSFDDGTGLTTTVTRRCTVKREVREDKTTSEKTMILP
jgi:hypothetical protein